MKNIKLIKWVAAGRYMPNINKRERKHSREETNQWTDDNYDSNIDNDNNDNNSNNNNTY